MKNVFLSIIYALGLVLALISCGNNTTKTKTETSNEMIGFETIVIKKEIAAFDDLKKSPNKIYTFEIAIPKVSDAENQWLTNEIKLILNIPQDQTIESGIENFIAKDGIEYKEIAKEITKGDYEFVEMLNNEKNVFLKSSFNTNGYLTLNYALSAYEGGAHGSYTFLLYNYDVIQKRKLKLSDVIDADTATLQVLLEKELRKEFNLDPNESLASILFEDEIKPNDNFFLSNDGIGFVFNTYEIAPYATGTISLLIPFSALNTQLVKDFAERMGLRKLES